MRSTPGYWIKGVEDVDDDDDDDGNDNGRGSMRKN